ncbi:MAG: TIGR03560 family F420-dependent LLM class oxidoreductase [Candidatus Bathyarchaeia archaeon]
MAKLNFGLIIPQGWQLELPPEMSPKEQFDLIVEMSKEAERIGYDSIWFFDHFQTSPLIPAVPPTHGKSSVFECWTTISAVAMETEKIRLGQIVTCALYRNPAYFGKISSVVDVMSNGRLELGIGAGWDEYEFKGYGYLFPKFKERAERLDETVEIIKKMWTEDITNYKGKYFKLVNNFNYPKPIQKPHPPILIGGGGEKYTLSVVAKHADKWNYGWGIEGYRKKKQALQKHCESIGRDIREIKFTYTSDLIVAETRKEAEELFVNWREQQSKVLGKKVKVNLEEFRSSQILGSTEEALETLERIVKELNVTEFILYMPVATDLKLMNLLHKDVVKPLKEYAESL